MISSSPSLTVHLASNQGLALVGAGGAEEDACCAIAGVGIGLDVKGMKAAGFSKVSNKTCGKNYSGERDGKEKEHALGVKPDEATAFAQAEGVGWW